MTFESETHEKITCRNCGGAGWDAAGKYRCPVCDGSGAEIVEIEIEEEEFMKTTKEELAAILSGREYGEEITEAECKLAKDAGLLVIFGYSDDNIEFRGAFKDESGCYGGKKVQFNKSALIEFSDEEEEVLRKFGVFDQVKGSASTVEAVWSQDGYSWQYKTSLPFAPFEIVEDREKYCRGIVIDTADMEAK